MRMKLIILIFLIAAGIKVNAQNAAQYIFTAQASSFTPISGTAVPAILGDDANSVMLPIGFNFTFCGVPYSQFMVSSNGWLSFINAGGSYRINQDPASVASISPSLLPLWDDLDMGTPWGGDAVYTVTGAPGSQIFTMQWLNAAWDYAADVTSISFQVKLYEGTNVIEYYYRQEANAPFLQFSGGATIGILKNPTDFLVLNDVSASPTTNASTFVVGLAARPATGQRYRFTPPAPCTGQPLAGTATATNTAFNCSGIPSLNLTGGTIATGITYSWESSPTGIAGSWIPVPGSSGLLSPAFVVNTPITTTTYYRAITTCAGSGQSNQSIPVQITVTPASAPVVTTPVNINCGDPASLSATPAPGGYMNWFTTTTGGVPFATGNTVSVSPTTNTTYYAEKFFPVTAINTSGATFVDHDVLSGDDRGGVAVSANYAYVTGDGTNGTVRYNKNNLTGGTAFPRKDGLFSDIMSQKLWVIGTSATTSYDNSSPATITHIFEVDENLAPTGVNFALSQTFASGTGRFIAPGYGFLIFYSGGTFYKISLSNGAVTTVGSGTLTFAGSESWASWGWSEFDGTDYFIYYVQNTTTISKRNLTTGTVTTVQSFSSLSDMASIVYNVATNKLYYHHEGSSQFGGSSETLGFLGVTSDNNCGYGVRTPLVVNVTPPSVTITTSPATICLGQSTTTTFTGTPNSNVTYTVNGGPNQNVVLNGSGTFALVASPTVNTTYNLVSVVSGSCSGAMTGTSAVTVNPRPNGQLVSNTVTVCKDAPASIGYAAAPTSFPIYVTFTDGTNTYTDTANATSGEIFPVSSSVAGTYNFSITSISNQYGCAGIPVTDYPITNTATVIVNNRPTATVTSADPGVCPGGNTDVTITFTGTPPFIFQYSDGTTSSNPAPEPTMSYTFNVSPTTTTTYYVENLFDGANCLALATDLDDSTTVEAWDSVAIVTDPVAVTACSHTAATITMTATGSQLNYTWFVGNTQVTGPNYTINNNTLTINDVTGLNGMEYYVVVDGVCGVDKISDTVTLTEDLNNNWSGTVSSDWNNGLNWSCGIVPTITTNAVIPSGPVNMPLVNIPGAVCRDLVIDAGASVMFTGTGNQLSVHGNINNTGTLNGAGGIVELAGTTQSISGPATFGDLEITGGGTKTLGGLTTVNGILNLSNGMVDLGPNDLALMQPVAQLGGSPASYIITSGTGTVVGNNIGLVGGNPDAVTFHVGINNASYTPIMLENLGDADAFHVRVRPNVYEDGVGTDPTLVTNPVINRTWMVSENLAGGSIVNMTPMWNSPINEINGFVQTHVFVAHYWNNEWISYVDSANGAPAAVAGTFPGMWMTTQDSIINFSPFTVASSGQFPLAIRLSSITATNVGTRNKVQWKSETEDAGDSYELESSADGKKFTKIATVAGNGKASTYTQWDEQPVQGVNYYRVKLVNIDGSSSYSKVVTATVRGTDGFSIEAYPNPVKNTVSVKVDGVVTGKATVVITDVTGKVVKAATQVLNNGAEINVTDLANGIYLLNYTDDVRSESIKINKQ